MMVHTAQPIVRGHRLSIMMLVITIASLTHMWSLGMSMWITSILVSVSHSTRYMLLRAALVSYDLYRTISERRQYGFRIDWALTVLLVFLLLLANYVPLIALVLLHLTASFIVSIYSLL